MALAGGARSAAAAAASVGLAPDLKKRVEIMAEHVARAGPEFESTVKCKNAGNPQFAFLLGGEGAEYYQALLQLHGAGGPGAGGAAAAPGSRELLELVRRWPEPAALPLEPELDRRLGEILAGLEHMASRDAIRAGREWLEANVASVSAIASGMMQRMRFLPTCAQRLHVLFLLHDVLQTEFARQEAYRPIITAFRPYLVWLLRPAFQLAQAAMPSADERQKILKLLSLWQERGLLGSTDATEIRVLATAPDLPPAPPKAARVPGLSQQLTGLAPGLLQQVQAQVQAQQAQQQVQGLVVPPPRPVQLASHTLGVVQGIPLVPQPAIPALLPPAGFTGVFRPALPGAAGVPGAIPPGAGALQPVTAVPLPGRGAQTPETVPVGVMAAMLKQVSKRGKDLHTAFVPYKPLDPMYTPQSPPPVPGATARLMERLAEYYEIVGDCAKEPPIALPAPPVIPAEQPPPPQKPPGGAGQSGAASKERSRSRSRSRSPPAAAAAAESQGEEAETAAAAAEGAAGALSEAAPAASSPLQELD